MTTIAIHQLRLSDVRNLALTLGPPLAGFVLIPTLACAAGSEAPPGWPQLPLGHATLLEHFTHVQGGGRSWTLLTSALCHADAAHRERNMLALVSAGWGPARELGRVGFALAFLGGHVAAVLNRSGHLLQLRRSLDANTYGMLPQWAQASGAKLWQQAVPHRLLGGSAGTFAVLGVDVCLKCEAAIALWRQWRDEALDDIDGDPLALSPSLGGLLMLSLNAWSICSLVWSEQRSLAAGASVSVGHAAHLTAFAFGVALYAARLAWRRYKRRTWDGTSGRGRGGGRVLGGRAREAGGGRRLGGR